MCLRIPTFLSEDKKLKELIKNLIFTPSPSGDEKLFSALVADELSPFCDKVTVDSMGNVLATKHSPQASAEPLTLCAHLDTSGFAVNYINDDGTLCVHPTGAHTRISDAYSRVSVNGKFGILLPVGESAYSVNIGAHSKEEAEELVSLGDFASVIPDFDEFPDGRLIGFGICTKASCALLLDIARELEETNRDINFVFTAQNGISNRGARLIASELAASSLAIQGTYGTAIIVDCIEKSGDTLCKIGVSDSLCIYSKNAVGALERASALCSVSAERVVTDKSFDVQSFLHAGFSAGALLISAENIGTSCEILSPKSAQDAKSILISLCKSN